MPKPKNTGLRILVPIIAVSISLLIVWATIRNGSTATPQATPAPVAAGPSAEQPAPPKDVPATPAPAAQQPAPVTAPAPVSPASSVATLRARTTATTQEATPIGSLDKTGTTRIEMRFASSGAGIASLKLAQHFTTITEDDHMQLQAEHVIARNGVNESLVPFAALAVEVTPAGQSPQVVGLFGDASARVWTQTGPGAFEAIIENEQGQAALRLTRRFTLAADSSVVHVEQFVENLTATAMSVKWYQTGPVDLSADAATYGGDRRFMRVGYLLPESRDPSRTPITMSAYDKARSSLLSQRYETTDASGAKFFAYRDFQQWPTPDSQTAQLDLSWVSFNNRYFGVAMHPWFAASKGSPAKPLAWVSQVDRIVLDAGNGAEVVGLRLASSSLAVAPGAKADFSHGLFAGPLSRKEIAAEPLLDSLHLKDIVIYNFGGPCGWCTFSSVTSLLLWVLRSLHDFVWHDWALSIIFLVVVVRTTLHPLTRWTQIKMARFSKQMQAVSPKQKILQEKYAGDPVKLQQETSKLWREEGISPAGFLGCLPAFAQTPVWIALSGMLFFAVELRHEHAFYGVVQSALSKGSLFWYFLGDLAEPDRLVYFGRTLFTAPLIGPISSLNLLPLILGVMYWLQQTYFTPQTTAPTTPEQETQMKVMKYMTIFMFPALMYNAPAGLSLYFTVNTTLAILESKWIRSYMERNDLLNVEKMKAERLARASVRGGGSANQGGFMAALERYAREKQNETERRFGQDRLKK